MPNKTEIRNCEKHGETEFSLSSNRFKCKKCNVELVTRARQKRKQKAIIYKGGKCCKCGYNKSFAALDFHHIDRNNKEFNISKSGVCRSWEKMKKELDKCELVCANCHREMEYEHRLTNDTSVSIITPKKIHKKRKNWPEKKELEDLLKQYSLSKVGKMLNISPSSIKRHAANIGINLKETMWYYNQNK